MPAPLRRPRAALALVTAAVGLAAAALPALPAAAATAAADGADAYRVVSTTPRLVERYAVPASGTRSPVVRAPDRSSYLRTAPGGDSSRSAAPRSTWRITYDAGFQGNALARSEFQRAVDTWAALVGSSVPITVDARFRSLGANVLGSAGPGGLVEEVPDERYTSDESVLPVALGNALAGRDLIPPDADTAGFDIVTSFPNDNPDIHYGTGPVPADKYDFFSTVLHEIGHGLGFTSTYEYAIDGTGRGSWGLDPRFPFVFDFDRNLTVGSDAGATPLLRLTSGTTQLGSAMTSRDVYWRGARAVEANGGRPVRMFAPSPYRDGSSLSHLDERTYPTGTANALMTPSGEPGEVNPDVGDLALGVLADIGWSVPVPAPGGPTGAPSTTPTTAPTTPAAPPAAAPAAATVTPPVAPSGSDAPGSRFTPLTPVRVLDTRSGLGARAGRVGPGETLDLRVVGGTTGVPVGATAVVLNVTAVGASSGTDVRVYPTPDDARVPTVSNINLAAGQTRAGVVTVPVGRDGTVRLRNAAGSVSLLADLAGSYAPDGQAAFHPVAPVRLLDTRGGGTKLGPGATLDLQVAGRGGVPASAAAVVLNVTGVGQTAATDIAVYPATAGTSRPGTSNLNLVPGPPVPNLVVAKVGDGGRVRIRNSNGSTDVLVDLSGWFDATAPNGTLFRPVSPTRLFDSRTDPDPTRRRLGPGGLRSHRMTDAVPSSATAVLLNVTAVAASGGTDLRVYPQTAADRLPEVSNLNLGTGQTSATAVVVGVGDGGDVLFRNAAGTVGVLSDLAGWFGP